MDVGKLMYSFRAFFKMWPIVLGAVLFGLAIRLTSGVAEQSVSIGSEPIPFSYPQLRLGSSE